MSRKFENNFNEENILNLIYDYKKDMKIIGKVKPRQVYEYVAENYELKKYPFLNKKPSYDYWRKWEYQGKKLIEKVNSINTEPVITNGDFEDVGEFVNTEEAVYKLFSGNGKDKQKLINILRINEVKAKKYFKRVRRLETQLEEELKLKNDYKQQVDSLQTILFQMMEHSATKGFPVDNFINTGKTKSESVKMVLEKVFSDNPISAYEFEQFQKQKKNKKNADNNIVPLKLKNKLSAADDLGLI